ncbi:MAG: archaetidylserine decarboxylase [Gammaproteobacteria bacterium]|nr:archaetidylserine decarboxylase [Gammaproteobacteria bacterium]
MPDWHGQKFWQVLLTRSAAKLANFTKCPPLKNYVLGRYVKHFNVDMSEAAEPDYRRYKSFNAFFTRALRPGARPIAAGNTFASPVDGTLSEFGDINAGQLLQAKNQHYSVEKLLAEQFDLANTFIDGSYCTCYLSPRDYHRIHMPLAGTLKQMWYVPGVLFPVYPAAVNTVPELFTKNERLICLFETTDGPMAVILVGAMIVGGMRTVWQGLVKGKRQQVKTWRYDEQNISLEKGEELGWFELGSCVIVLTKNKINWQNITSGQALKMGQSLGLTG